MKSLQIKKIEVDGDCWSITFAGLKREIEKGDFDLQQLGVDICYISSFGDMIMVAGTVTLKAGDSITDDFGGDAIIGANRAEAIKKDFGAAYRPTVDYRDAFVFQH